MNGFKKRNADIFIQLYVIVLYTILIGTSVIYGMEDSLLSKYATVSLEEMKTVKLMNRTDTKYVTTISGLRKLLQLAVDDYRAQQIDGEILMPYYTRYYDTPDYEMYMRHLHGRLTRKKVRVRRYVGSGLEFLEVKRKNNHGRTDKKRISTKIKDSILLDNSTEISRFLLESSGYDSRILKARIENSFRRLTLVNNDMTERLTIDMDIEFHNLDTDMRYQLPGLVIIELKRDGRTYSPIAEIIKTLRIKPSGFSKYCIGMALTNPGLPRNRFKPRLRRIGRMIDKENLSIGDR